MVSPGGSASFEIQYTNKSFTSSRVTCLLFLVDWRKKQK